MRNDYRGLIRSGKLREIIEELQAQGMTRPTLRSCYYLLLDRGFLLGAKKDYDNLDGVLSKERDAQGFPYGLLAPEGGTAVRGMLAKELEDHIARVQKENVEPELCDGILKVVLCEKAGLVDYLAEAVGRRIPVGSPGGMVRKEWAVDWLGRLKALAEKLESRDGRVELIYLGDYDPGGHAIRNHSREWYERWDGFTFDSFAVTEAQLSDLNRGRPSPLRTLHIDGYIALVGPQEFVRRLRAHLGI